MYYYSYKSFNEDVNRLIKKSQSFQPEIILAVARGGVTLGHFMAERMGLRALYTLNSIHYDGEKKLDTITLFNIPDLGENRRVLIVDDIVDSGESMVEILQTLKEKFPTNSYKTATLFYKKEAAIQPDFSCHEAKEWIEFFWSA
jgi:xanthine phosphoribosyltransferase